MLHGARLEPQRIHDWQNLGRHYVSRALVNPALLRPPQHCPGLWYHSNLRPPTVSLTTCLAATAISIFQTPDELAYTTLNLVAITYRLTASALLYDLHYSLFSVAPALYQAAPPVFNSFAPLLTSLPRLQWHPTTTTGEVDTRATEIGAEIATTT